MSSRLPGLCVGLLVMTALAACPAPSTSTPDAGAPLVMADAGVVVVVADARVVVADAGVVADSSVVETLVDAGTMADPPPPPTTTTKPDTTHPVTGFIHDRLLVKPRDSALTASAIERLVEKQLGAKVQTVRRTAGTFWLVQLAPTSPRRTKADQDRAIARLQKSGAFANVEGDQLMTIKAGFAPSVFLPGVIR